MKNYILLQKTLSFVLFGKILFSLSIRVVGNPMYCLQKIHEMPELCRRFNVFNMGLMHLLHVVVDRPHAVVDTPRAFASCSS